MKAHGSCRTWGVWDSGDLGIGASIPLIQCSCLYISTYVGLVIIPDINALIHHAVLHLRDNRLIAFSRSSRHAITSMLHDLRASSHLLQSIRIGYWSIENGSQRNRLHGFDRALNHAILETPPDGMLFLWLPALPLPWLTGGRNATLFPQNFSHKRGIPCSGRSPPASWKSPRSCR